MKILPRKDTAGTILRLALPVIAGLSTQMILSIVDTAMVGRLENAKYSLAAMGLGLFATWAIVSFCSSLSTGTHILVARRCGELQYSKCKDVLVNSIFVGFLLGLVIAIIGMLSSYSMAHTFAKDPTVGDLASEYMWWRFIGLPFFLITVSYRGFFFGIGNVKVFMVSAVLINITNIFFNYVLIYGEFGFPKMGVAGASLGSSLATMVDAFYYYIVSLMAKKQREKFSLYKQIGLSKEIIQALVKLALPVAFQNVFILLGFLSFVAITGLVGTLEQAATQAIISTMFLSFLPANGFGIAVQTLVGNMVGKGKITAAKMFGYETAKIASMYTIALAVLFIGFPEFLLSITTDDEKIISAAIPAMRVAGFAQIFFAAGAVYALGIQAIGKTVYVMIAEITSNLIVFVPLSYFFGIYLGYGLAGAWAALPFYTIIYSLLMWSNFRYGKWDGIKKI